jgi:hypothetical protein
MQLLPDDFYRVTLQGGTLSPIDQALGSEAVPITFSVGLYNFDRHASPTFLPDFPPLPALLLQSSRQFTLPGIRGQSPAPVVGGWWIWHLAVDICLLGRSPAQKRFVCHQIEELGW